MMLTTVTKRFALPFLTKKYSVAEIELAAVYAVAELKRNKGGGFFNRKNPEKVVFLTKMGYPFWLFPGKGRTFLFDGLGIADFNLSFVKMPLAKVYGAGLEAKTRHRETYASFLIDHCNYFKKNSKEVSIKLECLLAELNFLREFLVYHKEASDNLSATNITFLSPRVDEASITTTLFEIEKIQASLREDIQKLPELLRQIKKITGQFITELDYEAAAATEEINARIRAQQEIITPQIIELNKEHSRKTKDSEGYFNRELEGLAKLKSKTEKLMERNLEEIKQIQKDFKTHREKGHKIYEKRCKDKIKKTRKEYNQLKKSLKNIDNKIKIFTQQKRQAIVKLNHEFDREVKLARKPLLELEKERETKKNFFKQEAQKLLLLEKPVVDDLNIAISLHNSAIAKFEALGLMESVLQNPALSFVPFYLVCYETKINRRYLVIPPSVINKIGFSIRITSLFGKSKIKSLLIPQFKEISFFLQELEDKGKQNSIFDSQLFDMGQRSNLLGTNLFDEKIKKGLLDLQHQGWISDKEYHSLLTELST